MRERLRSWEAYLAGKMRLPPGYELEYGADVLLLRRADGSTVDAFPQKVVDIVLHLESETSRRRCWFPVSLLARQPLVQVSRQGELLAGRLGLVGVAPLLFPG